MRPRRGPVPGRPRAALALALVAAAAAACGGGADAGGGGSAADTVRDRDTSRARPVRRSPAGLRITTLRVGGEEVTVEVAETDAQRRRGLMGRDSLPEDHGMLFVYSRPQTLSFWMRNTEIPLDIAYISRDGVIVDIQQMEPHTEERHPSREPAMYALELPRGWFEEHGVEVGDRVRF